MVIDTLFARRNVINISIDHTVPIIPTANIKTTDCGVLEFELENMDMTCARTAKQAMRVTILTRRKKMYPGPGDAGSERVALEPGATSIVARFWELQWILARLGPRASWLALFEIDSSADGLKRENIGYNSIGYIFCALEEEKHVYVGREDSISPAPEKVASLMRVTWGEIEKQNSSGDKIRKEDVIKHDTEEAGEGLLQGPAQS
ncbi:hypothetical protein TWF679_000503 [Orbilia oligospora]|uniref:Uncharacterized protein n=1 Tax=Orbilia oligospora TaxID=2813651 RepID=A0A8H8UXL3_ORBOL|nr:hypothetical protein TWF679_000503 [Orbilia oligospora]